MNSKRVIKKTVSMVLVCAMLGSSFAQYTFAEENPEMDIVVEPEEIVLADAPEATLETPAAGEQMDSQATPTEEQEVLDDQTAAPEQEALDDQTAVPEQEALEQLTVQDQESPEEPGWAEISVEEITVEDPAPELAKENAAVVAALLGDDGGAPQIVADGTGATVESDFEWRDLGGSIKITGLKDGAKTKSDLTIVSRIDGKPVVEIGDAAFRNCTNFTGKLTLPEGLTTIGANAFENCPFTGTLTFPTSLRKIGFEAFKGCSGLSGGLNLASCRGLSVSTKAFSGCTSLNGALTLPNDLSGIDEDAFFDTVRMPDGNAVLELQVGGNEMDTPKILAGNSSLDLGGVVTWSSSDGTVIRIQNGKLKALKEGTATITATVKYNDKIKCVRNVVAAANSGAPTLKSVGISKTMILKPGTVDLSLNVTVGDMGITKMTGYFCQTAAPSKRLSFTVDWSASPKSAEALNGEPLRVNVPSSAEDGEYCLGGLTLTGKDGKTTTYTYDPAAKVWKNGNGNVVGISGTTVCTVKDVFAPGEKQIYITNEAEINNAIGSGASAVVIQYDGNNHTVRSDWFMQIAGQDISLILTNGVVAWRFYGQDIQTAKDVDCLVKVAQADTSGYGNSSVSMSAQFAAANGVLPGKATVRINAGQMNNLYGQTRQLFLFSVNANNTLNKAGTLAYVLSGGQYWYEFTVSNNTLSKMLMSSKELSLEPEYKVTKLALSKTKLGLNKGKSAKLTVTVTPSNASNKKVKWTSSNKKIVTVNSKGKIKAKRYGTATIKVTAQDGSKVSASCKVTVGYKITYKLNGGKNNKQNPDAYYKQTIKLKKPTRKGYKFQGWYTDSDFRHRIKKITKSYKINLVLYAKWKKK